MPSNQASTSEQRQARAEAVHQLVTQWQSLEPASRPTLGFWLKKHQDSLPPLEPQEQ